MTKRSAEIASIPENVTLLRAGEYFTGDFPFYIHRVEHKRRDFTREQRRQREFWKIVYVLEGEGRNLINDREYALAPGNVFLIHPNDSTSYIVTTPSIVIYNIIFMPELFGDEMQALGGEFEFFNIFYKNHYGVLSKSREVLFTLDQASRSLLRLIESIDDEFTNKNPNYRRMIKYRMLELIIELSREAAKRVQRAKQRHVVEYIDHMIGERYREGVTLEEIAQRTGFHRNYIGRVYKKSRGKTIFEALNEMRITKARTMLDENKMPITDICYETGFNDLSFFYRMFKRITGYAPGEYRRRSSKTA
ncbi:MAG: helix-turn-helix domain-containing protein [Spirochaetes bacterium]|nr:helix-turn-helix domain-containing protein [Spirochaetota bacterium]